jgi:hypothetical protein
MVLAIFWAWIDVQPDTFIIHPYVGYKITRQSFYLNLNVCNHHNHMWGEEVNSKFQCTNLSWINKHFETEDVKNKSYFLKMLEEKFVD